MTDPRPLAFIDCETTGLEPDRHEMWELAVILRAPGKDPVEGTWQLPVDLVTADPTSLQINHFYERYDAEMNDTPRLAAREIATMLDGATLIGSIPSFDAAFVDRFLRRNGSAPSWHYRLLCVESLAAGRLGLRPPWDTNEMGARLGCPKDPATQHTAMGDARWAMKVFDAVYASTPALASKQPPPSVVSEPAEQQEQAEAAADPEEIADPAGRPSLEEPSPCSNCGQSVPPREAMVSFIRMRKVLCSEPDGGCFSRMAAGAEA